MTSSSSVENQSIDQMWSEFGWFLERALTAARASFFRPNLRHLRSWHDRVLDAAASERARSALARVWREAESDDQRQAFQLLRLELAAVIAMLASVTAESPPFAPGWEEFHRVSPLLRPSARKQALKGASTLLGSLDEMIKNAPPWLKALLTALKEAIDAVLP